MKVVIDTNVSLNAIYRRSKNYWIRQVLERGLISLCVTTDILDEYAEVFADYYDTTTFHDLIRTTLVTAFFLDDHTKIFLGANISNHP